MISREQVADLQPGDVVELTWDEYPGHVVRSVVRQERDGKRLGPGLLAWGSGEVATWVRDVTLTVVSRAPRPLYVNHPRTEAKEHDVVRDGHGVIRHHGPVADSTDPTWWSWEVEPGFRWTWTSAPPQPLTLLVDGETGQVVQ